MKLTREDKKTYCGAKIELRYGSTACGNDFHGERMQCDRCKGDSVHVDKPLAESAAAPGECGSVPDAAVWISETLIRDEWVNHVSTDPSIHHWPEVLAFARRIAAISANKGYRTALQDVVGEGK